LSCHFTSTIRQRGPTKPHDGSEAKHKVRRPSTSATKKPVRKRKAVVLSPDTDGNESEFVEEDEDVSPNHLGLQLVPTSENMDADAEGEEDYSSQPRYTLPESLSSLNNQSTYPYTFSAPLGTYGFNFQSTSTTTQSLSSSSAFIQSVSPSFTQTISPTLTQASSFNPHPPNTLRDYANAATRIRKEAQKQLALANRGISNGHSIGPGDDGGWDTSGFSEVNQLGESPMMRDGRRMSTFLALPQS